MENLNLQFSANYIHEYRRAKTAKNGYQNIRIYKMVLRPKKGHVTKLCLKSDNFKI